MMRKRLRPMPSPDELARLYAKPHQHVRWADHRIRVDVTTTLACHVARAGGTVADLSCGDGAIALALQSTGMRAILGDYAPGYPIQGPIEETIHRIEPVDLYICSETVEHLDDPDSALAAIRQKTSTLVLSTPDGETDDSNPEHVWGWDAEAVEKMLRSAGFIPTSHTTLDLRPAGFVYSYQIWCCR